MKTSFDDPFSEYTSPQKQPSVRHPPEELEPGEDFAPTATEMRKSLAASKKPTQTSLTFDSDSDSPPPNPSPVTKSRKRPLNKPDDIVIAAARERKRVALEQSRIAAKELAAAIQDHANLRNLGQVEFFAVELSQKKSDDGGTDRWNPLWNGRKNFKKFRKAKQSASVGVSKHLIPLVEHKGKSAVSQGTLSFFSFVHVEFFFPAPIRGSKTGSVDSAFDDLAMEDTPTTAPSRNTKQSQKKQGGRTSRLTRTNTNRASLFLADDSSDNDLGFDSD